MTPDEIAERLDAIIATIELVDDLENGRDCTKCALTYEQLMEETAELRMK